MTWRGRCPDTQGAEPSVMKDSSLWRPTGRADAVGEGMRKGNRAMEQRQMKRMQDFGAGRKTAEAFAPERASADGERSL